LQILDDDAAMLVIPAMPRNDKGGVPQLRDIIKRRINQFRGLTNPIRGFLPAVEMVQAAKAMPKTANFHSLPSSSFLKTTALHSLCSTQP
jgi:hypothetical protein